MRKTIRLLSALLCACFLAMCGCSAQEQIQEQVIVTTDDYKIIKQNDQFLMEVTNPKITSSALASEVIVYPSYESVSDMKASILNNSFTESDYHAISIMVSRNGGEIPLFDLDTLYEPMLPDGMQYEKVTWRGERYFFSFSQGDMSGSLHLINREMFDQHIDEEFTGYFDSDNRTLDETEQDLTRGGTIYYYHTSVTSLKAHMYTFQQGSKVIYVREDYFSPYSDEPWTIAIWGFDGQNYYEVLLINSNAWDTLTQKSSEWYLAFGLTPYVENAETA